MTPRCLSFLCLLALLGATSLHGAAPASLVADLTPETIAGNIDNAGVWEGLVTVGGKVLFTAGSPDSGMELWVSDGTVDGTEILADLCPGRCRSNPKLLGTAGGIAVFSIRREGAFVGELWRTDGTRPGTFLLGASNRGGPVPCDDRESAVLGDRLYFQASLPGQGCELWATDGTPGGTRLVKDLVPGPQSNMLFDFTVFGGSLYFFARTRDAMELWRSDGTAAGTVVLRTLQNPSDSMPRLLTVVGSRLFFIAVDDGEELWTTDGTAAGTRPVTRFTARNALRSTTFLREIDGLIYFLADDGAGLEIWRTDGTAAGTRPVTAFTNVYALWGTTGSQIARIGGRLVFVANDGLTGRRLWTSGGTPETTAPVPCPGDCPEVEESAPLVPLEGRLLFSAADPARGAELWSTDGTSYVLVRDICPGECPSGPAMLTTFAGRVWFFAHRSSEYELWTTDGTASGTVAIAGLGPSPLRFDEQPLRPLVVEDRIFFVARNEVEVAQLWVSDGTAGGTQALTRIGQMGMSSNPQLLASFRGELLFSICTEEFSGLWKSGGTEATTELIDEVLEDGDCLGAASPASTVVSGGLAFFLAEHPWTSNPQLGRTDGTETGTFLLKPDPDRFVTGPFLLGQQVVFFLAEREAEPSLWETDGTEAGTRKLVDLSGGPPVLRDFTVLGSRIWFVRTQGSHNNGELWVSNGTAAGTRKVAGFTYHDAFRTRPELTQVGNTVFFLVNARGSGLELWKTDGTSQGTSAVLPDSAKLRNPSDLVEHQGALYFLASIPRSTPQGSDRRGLWRSDGTAAGTVLVKDWVMPYSEPGAGMTKFGGMLFFVIADGENGRELWRSDGTTAGTVLVRDIAPGTASSNPTGLVVAAGRLFFTAGDLDHGSELWESDGTREGTHLVQDIAPGGRSSSPEGLTVVGQQLFFSADDGTTGRELWVLPLAPPPECRPSDEVLCLQGGRFRIEATWRDFSGHSGRGRAVSLTADTGYFWFFDAANVEVILKVLDGRSLNGHHWVFYGALSSVEYTLTVVDTWTGATRRYINPPGRLASIADTSAFGPQKTTGSGLASGRASVASEPIVRTGANAAAVPCVPSATRLCLQNGRFAVEARWKDFAGKTGTGQAVALSGGDTGYFWFFGTDNVEVVLKVLDGRPLNSKFWVFYGALSSVEYTLTVTDTETGKVKTYANPSGRLASVADTAAF